MKPSGATTSLLHKCSKCGKPCDTAHSDVCLVCLLVAMTPAQTGPVVKKPKRLGNAAGGKSKRAGRAPIRKRVRAKSYRVVVADPVVEEYLFERRSSKRGNCCVLCGAFVPRGQMLEHKAKIHLEVTVPRTPRAEEPRRVRVKFVSGGLPGLGKNSR